MNHLEENWKILQIQSYKTTAFSIFDISMDLAFKTSPFQTEDLFSSVSLIQIKVLLCMIYLQLDHHEVGLMVIQIILRSEWVKIWRHQPLHCAPDPTEPDRRRPFFFFSLPYHVWFGRSSLAHTVEHKPRITKAGLCQRFRQKPRGKNRSVMWKKNESDIPNFKVEKSK